MREIPESEVSIVLSNQDYLAACDVAVFVYDRYGANEFPCSMLCYKALGVVVLHSCVAFTNIYLYMVLLVSKNNVSKTCSFPIYVLYVNQLPMMALFESQEGRKGK